MQKKLESGTMENEMFYAELKHSIKHKTCRTHTINSQKCAEQKAGDSKGVKKLFDQR